MGQGNLVVGLHGFLHSLPSSSRVSHQNSIFQPSTSSRVFLQSGYLNFGSKGASFINGFASSSSSSSSSSSKRIDTRCYYVDNKNVHHFKPRGVKHWFQDVMNVVIVGSCLLSLCFAKMETVPYTNRPHLILISKAVERWFGEIMFEVMKISYKGELLPSTDPECMRVRIIANNIIYALKRSRSESLLLSALTKKEGNWHLKSQPYMSHLDGLNWDILVAKGPVRAFCLIGGKIVVFTGMLELCHTDDEIAAIIGHEVGHVVARHTVESITNQLWIIILQLILYSFTMPKIFNKMWSLLLQRFISRRREIEADYIGLILLASAGYDPRAAPKLYKKFQRITGNSTIFSTHPSGNKRAELLAQTRVMEEALTIYKKNARAGSGGFNAQVQDFPTTRNPAILVALSVLFLVTVYFFKFYF